MKELVWDQTLSVQVDEIDDDRRRLMDLFNLLQRAVADSDDLEYVIAVPAAQFVTVAGEPHVGPLF